MLRVQQSTIGRIIDEIKLASGLPLREEPTQLLWDQPGMRNPNRNAEA